MARSLVLCSVETIPEGRGRNFQVDGHEIAVFRSGGAFHALSGRCPHQGAPLEDAEVVGGEVVCAWHGWSFDLATGRRADEPGESLQRFPVRVVGGMLVVELP